MKRCDNNAANSVLDVKPGDTVRGKVGGEYYLVAEAPRRPSHYPQPRGAFLFSLETGKHRRVERLVDSAWEKVNCCFKECEGEATC